MMTISESPLARKIRALMAKANDKSVTEAEAAAYAAKVQELLVKNGLSMSDVKKDDEVERGDVGRQEFAEAWKSPSRKQLLRAVCRFYMCEAIGPAYKGGAWNIVGRPHNVAVAVEMTDYLIKTTVRLSNQWARAEPMRNAIDFRKGCMARLCERLNEMRAEQAQQKAEYRPDGNPGNLPALFVSERTAIGLFIKRAMPNVRYTSARPIRGGADGMSAGRSAAAGISLHSQVGGGARGGGRLAIGKG